MPSCSSTFIALAICVVFFSACRQDLRSVEEKKSGPEVPSITPFNKVGPSELFPEGLTPGWTNAAEQLIRERNDIIKAYDDLEKTIPQCTRESTDCAEQWDRFETAAKSVGQRVFDMVPLCGPWKMVPAQYKDWMHQHQDFARSRGDQVAYNAYSFLRYQKKELGQNLSEEHHFGPPLLGVSCIESGEVVIAETIDFSSGATLNPLKEKDNLASMKEIVGMMTLFSNFHLMINGYKEPGEDDPKGDLTYQRELAVKAQLIAMGGDPTRMRCKSEPENPKKKPAVSPAKPATSSAKPPATSQKLLSPSYPSFATPPWYALIPRDKKKVGFSLDYVLRVPLFAGVTKLF